MKVGWIRISAETPGDVFEGTSAQCDDCFGLTTDEARIPEVAAVFAAARGWRIELFAGQPTRWGVWRIEDDRPGHEYHLGLIEHGAQALGPGQRAVLIHEFESPWREGHEEEDLDAANRIAQPVMQADRDRVEGLS